MLQAQTIRAVLFDRDDTLIADEPRYNGRPELVRPLPDAWQALARLRAAGLQLGMVSNQSGIGRGMLSQAEVDAVNARVEELLGPFDTIQYCPHAPEDGCTCRKPGPDLIQRAADAVGVPTSEVVVIGDIGSDVAAARAAGALAILVPTQRTLPEEVAAAPVVAADLSQAADLVLDVVLRGWR